MAFVERADVEIRLAAFEHVDHRPRKKTRMRSHTAISSSSLSVSMITALSCDSSVRIARRISGLVARSTPRVGSLKINSRGAGQCQPADQHLLLVAARQPAHAGLRTGSLHLEFPIFSA